MKREIYNSVVGTLGLFIASVTAWFQFAPAADQIEVVVEGRLNLRHEISIEPVGLEAVFDKGPMSTAGPVSWKIRLYNASDRPVSVVSYSLFLLGPAGGKIHFSSMNERLSPAEAILEYQTLPVVLAPREAKGFGISLALPFERDQDTERKCEDFNRQLLELERCFFLKGRDLFGNPVTVTAYGEGVDSPISVSWEQEIRGPNFLIEFETADGSVFRTPFSYYPFK